MPRLARLDAPGILHHVMGRGIERKEIFISNTDRSDFIDRLAALAEEGAMDVYAWVLMPNHFHLLCKTRNRPLSSSMSKILTGYTDYVLSYFGQNRYRRRNYQRYVQKGATMGRRPELVGGGLVRSQGGWSEVLALRSRGERSRSDQRILGNSEFVQEVISGLEDLVKKNLRLSGQRIDINALVQEVCRKYDISLGELRSGSRRRVVVEARGAISWIAVRELGYSGADVARYLGVTNSCVTRFVASDKKPDIDHLIRKL
jgi:REP element-mobilizing transposase RayT